MVIMMAVNYVNQMTTCKRCDTAVYPNTRFCPNCGAPLQPLPPQKKKSNTLPIILCVVGALVVISIIGEIYKASNKASNGTTVSRTPFVDDVAEEEYDENEWANAFTPISDFRYTLDKENKTITLNKYQEFGPKVMLSPVYTIDGIDYSLKALGDACFLGKIRITSVYIPEGVTDISHNCFNSCSSLQYLYIPSTVESLEESFFGYLQEYTAYYESFANLPGDRDYNNYKETIDEIGAAGELGESFAGALNGIMGGLSSDPDNPIITQIYFGGTESQWRSIKK